MKTTWHTHKQNLFCVTCDCIMIYWATTHGKEFIVSVFLLPKRHCRVKGCFNQCSPFYHMLCDVASIFAVRTLVVSQAYTMVLTLIYTT